MILPFFTFVLTFPLITMAVGTFEGAIKSNCPTQCGNIVVPYPFGIGADCSFNPSFNLTCNTSTEPPKLYLEDTNIRIYNITNTNVRTFTTVSYKCFNRGGVRRIAGMDLQQDGVFTFSVKNKFTVIGCDEYVLIRRSTSSNISSIITSGCFGLCLNATDVPRGQCSGIGCCQASIPNGLSYFNETLYSLRSHQDVLSFNKCGYGFLVEEGTFKFEGASDLSTNHVDFVERIESTMPMVLDWVIEPNKSCKHNICKENSVCHDGESGRGYRCICKNGYGGNPYLDPGCQDINECEDQQTNRCYGDCVNTLGSYICTCPSRSVGNGHILNGCQLVSQQLNTTIIIGISVSMGVLVIVALGYALYKAIKKTKKRRQREWFFKRNGGILLKQQEKAYSSLGDKTIIFTSRELEKATENFNENRILGRGGHGTVYKGMLVDGRIVAVRKSKLVDESEIDQFINEVVILSQINHRNVVKLLGCCLETEVPLLVSEFIPNGTLYDRLHNDTEEFPISLNMRLQIATETAGALSYLHSATSTPIYHRDVKTSNILLDDKYRAKVSDFGTSRFVSIEQTHLTTLVKGTFGYLDPEYFQSSQFTEKSDVYSFGVVLVELLTREKPISLTRFGETRSLATHFMLAMEEGRVMSVLDSVVVNEGSRNGLLALANLAMRCLNLNGKYRPTMKDVAAELETIRTSHIPSTVPTSISPITYKEEINLPYGESSSTLMSFNDSISQ